MAGIKATLARGLSIDEVGVVEKGSRVLVPVNAVSFVVPHDEFDMSIIAMRKGPFSFLEVTESVDTIEKQLNGWKA